MQTFISQRDRQHQQSHAAVALCTEREIQQNVLPSGTYPTIPHTGMLDLPLYILWRYAYAMPPVSNPIITPFVPLSSSLGRRSTGTSVSSSSQWERTARIRPSVSAWGNTKAAPAPSSGRPSRATSQPRPKGWSASSRSSSGTLVNGNTVTEKNFCSKVRTRHRQWGLLMLLMTQKHHIHIFFKLLLRLKVNWKAQFYLF